MRTDNRPMFYLLQIKIPRKNNNRLKSWVTPTPVINNGKEYKNALCSDPGLIHKYVWEKRLKYLKHGTRTMKYLYQRDFRFSGNIWMLRVSEQYAIKKLQ